MAIKVGGTSVISDSRVLENVTGLKTVDGQSLLGSGDISVDPPTGQGEIGTYSYGRPANTTGYAVGDTATSFYSVASGYLGQPRYGTSDGWTDTGGQNLESGTWRCMNGAPSQGGWGVPGIWVRIS